MKTNCLIGDSGGTSTNWCWLDAQGQSHYFESESYHPSNFNAAFFEAMKSYWDEKALAVQELYFYGAGCGIASNKATLSSHFKELGWVIRELESDALGSCRAYFGEESGSLAILGTGSVLMRYHHGELLEQIGGLGHLLGDEGSGYYFGKLLLQAWLNGDLSPSLTEVLQAELGNRSSVLQEVYASAGKKWVSALAAQSATWSEFEELECLHEENLEKFVKTHILSHHRKEEKLVIIGGYAFAKTEMLQHILKKHQIFEFLIEKSPLEKMVNRVSK